MKRSLAASRLGLLAFLACASAAVVLRAWPNPDHIMQWLGLLQWCR